MEANEEGRANSRRLMQRAARLIPGGVNSPVRAFSGVGGTPVSFESGSGAFLEDLDGNRYIDYVGSWGPMILGHAPPAVVEAVTRQARRGLGFGAPTELEVSMAEQIVSMMPSMEMVRMVNSGTEATMSAIRLARGFTGRDLIVKFSGCYHGHSDSLLVKAGSGVLTLALPNSPGVPEAFAAHTLSLPYNDAGAVTEALEQYGNRIAAVIVEPVAGNMGCVPPIPGFLETLRELTERHGAVLIFDEVMTGFRVARGGAQALYDVQPDLTTLGKIIGGGLPVGAFGGRGDIMRELAPSGPVYQAGTLSGNPLAMAAGLVTLKTLEREDFYTALSRKSDYLAEGLRTLARKHGIDACVNAVCGMFSVFFTDSESITSFEDVAGCDQKAFNRFFHAMLERGVYLAPSAFESAFISGAHEYEQLDETLAAADEALREQRR